MGLYQEQLEKQNEQLREQLKRVSYHEGHL